MIKNDWLHVADFDGCRPADDFWKTFFDTVGDHLVTKFDDEWVVVFPSDWTQVDDRRVVGNMGSMRS